MRGCQGAALTHFYTKRHGGRRAEDTGAGGCDCSGGIIRKHGLEPAIRTAGNWTPAARPFKPRVRVFLGGLAVVCRWQYLPGISEAVVTGGFKLPTARASRSP